MIPVRPKNWAFSKKNERLGMMDLCTGSKPITIKEAHRPLSDQRATT
jgi:hypothetical protein